MKTAILFLAMLVTLSWGCKKKNTVSTTEPCMGIDTFPLQDTTRYTDAITVNSSNVSGDFLKLNISYGGGCANHDFKLVWNQFATSPQMLIGLAHNAHGDQCKSLISKELCFNLSKLRYDARQAHGEIDFNLNYNNSGTTSTIPVKYKF